jgi:hypothetical protein
MWGAMDDDEDEKSLNGEFGNGRCEVSRYAK